VDLDVADVSAGHLGLSLGVCVCVVVVVGRYRDNS
jgi:hypothetical protein